MELSKQKCTELATRVYELDGEVYKAVGSSLGRTFTGGRETTIRNLSGLMFRHPDGHLLRSEMALISNMARTIKKDDVREKLMKEYDELLKEIEALPNSFSQFDIVDKERVALNNLISRYRKIGAEDHLVICISRTQGSGGNEIGFELADNLHLNYYDAEIFNQVLRRLEVDREEVKDSESDYMFEFDKYGKRKRTLREKLKDFDRYHGLPSQDAMFFNMTDLICDLAQNEDCVIMGRCADAILKNAGIPHISLFISAPMAVRVKRVMETRNVDLKQAARFIRKMDNQHKNYYNFYTGLKWGKPDNYDLCINSANYGIRETIDVIRRLIDRPAKVDED